jgi:epoxyqueuosine reductase
VRINGTGVVEEPGVRLGREVVARCRAAGFALAGVCGVERSRYEAHLRRWLSEGRQGSMEYLARNVDLRVDPAGLLEGARSMILVADLYASRVDAGEGASGAPPSIGWIARYARGRDYHRVIRARLHALADRLRAAHPGARFRSFVDTAPVLEREHAARAGLGWIGRHTLLIHPRLGSYLLLGGIVTTLELRPPPEQVPVEDHCGTCTRCIDACPTRAITPYSVDASRCISYLTIEHRGRIDPQFHGPIGDWIFGCDICQEVCPHNSPRMRRGDDPPTILPDYSPRRTFLPPDDVLGWTEDDRRRALAGTPVIRATLAMLKRNAVIVLGNALRRHEDRALRERLAAVAADEHEAPMVRTAAQDVLESLRARDGRSDREP